MEKLRIQIKRISTDETHQGCTRAKIIRDSPPEKFKKNRMYVPIEISIVHSNPFCFFALRY